MLAAINALLQPAECSVLAAVELTKVLCVDDEPYIIEGLSLNLHDEFEVTPAHNAAQGLKALDTEGPFAAVLSDLRMPGEDGISFLAKVRDHAPDTVRMLLTGHADVQAAIDAVNRGQLFRFLTKPCPPDQLVLAFKAAAEQYRLLTAERVLLEQTLHGSIKTLADVLSLTNPVSFGRTMRIRKYVCDLADRLGFHERWQVEVAAMLSQLGFIILPTETVEKLYYGQPLGARELETVNSVPEVTQQLLGSIPRLETVRAILARALERRYQRTAPIPDDPEQQLIENGAQLLKVALDFDELESYGSTTEHALVLMRARDNTYDPVILDAFAALKLNRKHERQIRELPISGVREGMVLEEDLLLSNGTLLASRGSEVTASFVERMRHLQLALMRSSVRVSMQNATP